MRAKRKSKVLPLSRPKPAPAVRAKTVHTALRPATAQPPIHKCHRWHNWLVEQYPF